MITQSPGQHDTRMAGTSLLLSARAGGVLSVGVGESFELDLVEVAQEIIFHGGQLHRLVSKGSVEITYIHRIFLQKKTNKMSK